jgi:hypothetical protein
MMIATDGAGGIHKSMMITYYLCAEILLTLLFSQHGYELFMVSVGFQITCQLRNPTTNAHYYKQSH